MAAEGTGRRVALLARPGVACDRLRSALAEAGAQLVLEGDPVTMDPSALGTAQAQVLLVALDAQTEEALDRFEAALHDPAIEVIFEEAELAARREGWEAARWVRHLSAKLHRHADVLPPGGEQDAAVEPGALSIDLPTPEAVPDFEHAMPPAADAAPEPAYVGGFDPVAAEMDGLEIDAREVAPFSFGDFELSLDELPAERDAGQGDAHPVDAPFDVDPPPPPHSEPAEVAVVAADSGGDAAESGGDNAFGLMELSLDEMSPEAPGPADTAADREADHRFRHDLDDLDRRISSMELVDDRIVNGPAQATGAVLVLSGIGGPDAVRQLLGALPKDFARPVLVQQRLDGGRFDKLVTQMQRATALPVQLAEAGLPATAGMVYILPTDVGIAVGELGVEFVAGGDGVLAALPSADSAVLLLSGSDPTLVDAVMNHSWAGALVAGQAPDGCYDAAASSALVARGGVAGQPVELAQRLAERWRS